MRHVMLAPQNIAMRRTFRWTFSVQKILHAVRPVPFSGRRLLIGSDYGGNHSASSYKTYGFLVANDEPSSWLRERKSIRAEFLTDGRRMSFKRLSDPQRQAALVPFLEAADGISGHLVVFVVHKSVRLHPSKKGDIREWQKNLGLSGKWNHQAFEEAFRKAHFYALLTSQWSRRRMDVTWISDQDEFVANEKRLDDAQKLAAKLTMLHSPHSLGIFAMNTTRIDEASREFEDFVAIPDLAAGMLSDLSSQLVKSATWSDLGTSTVLQDDVLQPKSDLLVDWFWFEKANLRRTCIVIDNVEKQTRVFKLDHLLV